MASSVVEPCPKKASNNASRLSSTAEINLPTVSADRRTELYTDSQDLVRTVVTSAS